MLFIFIFLCFVICDKNELTQSVSQEAVNDVAIINKGFINSIKKYVKNLVENVPAAKAKNHYSSSIYSIEAKSTTDDINENTDSDEIINGSCGDNVNFTLNISSGELFIYGSGKMKDIGLLTRSAWYEYKDYINSVVINDSVTSIGNSTFDDCGKITSVSIPASVASIGRHAFYNNYMLSSINIPNNVKYIGKEAFYNCSSLTSVNLPNNITLIEYNTFCECSKLSSITIPESVTSIGQSAFDSTGLTSIFIPKSVHSIGEYAF